MTAVRLTVLGCGSSSGTPVTGCDCAVCRSPLPENTRSRCSAYVRIGGEGWVIDTGTDFRHQALREALPRVDGVLYTHPHADHLNGIDDLRAFCYRQQGAIPVYGSDFTLDNIETRFDYAFLPPTPYWNRPVLNACRLPESENGTPVLEVAGVPLWHYGAPHGRWRSSLYRIGNIAWVTDVNRLDDAVVAALAGLDYLFLDCLNEAEYPSHLSVAQAFDYARRIGARQTYFIHMTHFLDYADLNRRSPPRCAAAYDGLSVCSEWRAA